MASKTTNPALLAAATGLGILHQRAADDPRVNSPTLREIQEQFVARRSRLAPSHARVVAELLFDRRAA